MMYSTGMTDATVAFDHHAATSSCSGNSSTHSRCHSCGESVIGEHYRYESRPSRDDYYYADLVVPPDEEEREPPPWWEPRGAKYKEPYKGPAPWKSQGKFPFAKLKQQRPRDGLK